MSPTNIGFLSIRSDVFVKGKGWATGTNVAPTCGTLVLRYYERTILSLYPSLKPMRFIDDAGTFYPTFSTLSFKPFLRTMYPPNLSFDILPKGVTFRYFSFGCAYRHCPPLEV